MPTRYPITNADQVRAYLALADAACPRCRYPLHGLRNPTCPECGTTLTVMDLARPRGLAALRAFFTTPNHTPRTLRILAAINILLALAIMASSVMNHGHLPLLSWLAPGVLGAFAFSIQYIAVFARYDSTRFDPIEGWAEFIATVLLVIQAAGLVLMWV